MELVKYSKYKEGKVYNNIVNSSSDSSSSSSSSTTTDSRTLWGNDDSGSDLSNSMKIEGNIYLKAFDPSSETRGDSSDDDKENDKEEFPPQDEEMEGSIYADGNVYCKNLETKEDAYIHRHLYINYPNHPTHSDANKKCLGEILKQDEDNIKINADNIDILDITVKNLNDDLIALAQRVSALETSVQMCIDGIDANTQRIYSLGSNISTLGSAVSTLTTDVATLQSAVDNHDDRMQQIEDRLTYLEDA